MTNNIICPRCGGILLGGIPPPGTAVTLVGDLWYHAICGFKEQQRLRNERWASFEKQKQLDKDWGDL